MKGSECLYFFKDEYDFRHGLILALNLVMVWINECIAMCLPGFYITCNNGSSLQVLRVFMAICGTFIGIGCKIQIFGYCSRGVRVSNCRQLAWDVY